MVRERSNDAHRTRSSPNDDANGLYERADDLQGFCKTSHAFTHAQSKHTLTYWPTGSEVDGCRFAKADANWLTVT